MSNTVCVIGGGGHARVVMDAVRASGMAILGVYDDNPGDYGVPYLGKIADITVQTCICAIGDLTIRARIIDRLPGARWQAVVHPAAILSSSAVVEPGAFVGAGAIINTNAVIEAHAIINSGAIIEHDVVIGQNTHLAPGVVTCGGVRIGRNTFVGAGTVIPNRNSRGAISIGNDCFINAGSIVDKSVGNNAHVRHKYQ